MNSAVSSCRRSTIAIEVIASRTVTNGFRFREQHKSPTIAPNATVLNGQFGGCWAKTRSFAMAKTMVKKCFE
jgi:hypothetical protein